MLYNHDEENDFDTEKQNVVTSRVENHKRTTVITVVNSGNKWPLLLPLLAYFQGKIDSEGQVIRKIH